MKKQCTDCGEEKTFSQFSTRKNPGKTKTIYYSPACKKCMVARSMKWIKKNLEKYRKYQNKYHKVHYSK